MHLSLRNFFLKSVPYLLAIAGGAVLFWLTADKIQNADLRDLVNNIAASLLAIPLVFLLYDYSNYLISRRLSSAQNSNIHDKIDNLMLEIIILMRQMLGMRGTLSLGVLNKMSDLSAHEIGSRLKIRTNHMQALQNCYQELDLLIYRGTDVSVLSVVQQQSLSVLARYMLHLINTRRFHQNKRVTAQYVEKIIGFIADWVDTDASISLHFQQLTQNSYAKVSGHKSADANKK